MHEISLIEDPRFADGKNGGKRMIISQASASRGNLQDPKPRNPAARKKDTRLNAIPEMGEDGEEEEDDDEDAF